MTLLLAVIMHFFAAGSTPRPVLVVRPAGYTSAQVWCNGRNALFIGHMTSAKARSPQPQLMAAGRFSYTTQNHYQFTEGSDALMRTWVGSVCSPPTVSGFPGAFHPPG